MCRPDQSNLKSIRYYASISQCNLNYLLHLYKSDVPNSPQPQTTQVGPMVKFPSNVLKLKSPFNAPSIPVRASLSKILISLVASFPTTTYLPSASPEMEKCRGIFPSISFFVKNVRCCASPSSPACIAKMAILSTVFGSVFRFEA